MFKNIRGDLRIKRNIDVENELHVKESLLLGTEDAPTDSHIIYSASNKPSQLNGDLNINANVDIENKIYIKDSLVLGTKNEPNEPHIIYSESNKPSQLKGKLKLNKSDALSPQYTFDNDEDTGIFSDEDNKLAFTTNGSEKLVITEDGRVYGNNLHVATPSIISDKQKQYISSGTYTPILLLISNIEDAIVYECHYTRIGNVVTVSGRVDIDISTAYGNSELNISLPIPSTLDGPGSLSGVAKATSDATSCIAICPDTIDDEARFLWNDQKTVNNKEYYFTFTYLIT